MSKDIEDLIKLIDEKPKIDTKKRKFELLSKYKDNDEVFELIYICEQLAYEEGYKQGINEDSIK